MPLTKKIRVRGKSAKARLRRPGILPIRRRI